MELIGRRLPPETSSWVGLEKPNEPSPDSSSSIVQYVVIGGGVSGFMATQGLCSNVKETGHITLLSDAPVLKGVANVKALSKALTEFDVTTSHYSALNSPNVTVLHARVISLDPSSKTVSYVLLDGHHESGNGSEVMVLHYDVALVASGAKPTSIAPNSPAVLSIRDTASVERLTEKLSGARRVIVVGNGGIAMELVAAVGHTQVVWAIKDEHIGNVFLDPAAAAFLAPELWPQGASSGTSNDEEGNRGVSGMTGVTGGEEEEEELVAGHKLPVRGAPSVVRYGSALGPNWTRHIAQLSSHVARSDPGAVDGLTTVTPLNRGELADTTPGAPSRLLHVERSVTIVGIHLASDYPDGLPEHLSSRVVGMKERMEASGEWRESNEARASTLECDDWAVWVELSNGAVFGGDFIVSATGVTPNVDLLTASGCFDLAPDEIGGGVWIDEYMRTSAKDVFAAGDVVAVRPECYTAHGWTQMRLWSQARVMGIYVASCMSGQVHEFSSGMAFELFGHVTRFFGYKVVLLGRFNAQGYSPEDVTLIVRQDPGNGPEDRAYIKVVVVGGKVVGALLVGETDLEETMENLILNELDVSRYGADLLDPDIDLEDYFD